MALPAIPSTLKPLTRFFQHATQFDKAFPVSAYYCRLFALEQIMSLPTKTAEDKTFLLALMNKVESDADSALGTGDSKMNRVESQATCEQNALTIFTSADNLDREQTPDKNTAKAFYAASVLMEVCSQFGELSQDFQEKLKYAQWKAADITKCLREGRVPMSGNGTSDSSSSSLNNESKASLPGEQYTSLLPAAPTSSVSSSYAAPQYSNYPATQPGQVYTPQYPSNPTPQVYPTSQQQNFVPTPQPQSYPQQQQYVQQSYPQSLPPQSSGGQPLTKERLAAMENKIEACSLAEKLTRHALGSLHFQDIETSVKKLEEALSLLRPWNK